MAGRDKKARDILRLRRALMRGEHALADAERALLAPHQICTSDLEILERLARKDRERVNALATRVGLTSGSMTTAVQRLRRRELVATSRDLEDKRVVWVEVTALGRALAEKLTTRRVEFLADLFEAWSGREQAILTNFLKRLRKDAESSPKEGIPAD